MNLKSLKLGYDTENHHYLIHLLSKQGLAPDPKYSGSPKYLKAWSMVEAGRLLNQSVTRWESELKKEITRLDDNLITLAQLERERAEEMERLMEDTDYRVEMVVRALLRDSLAPKTNS